MDGNFISAVMSDVGREDLTADHLGEFAIEFIECVIRSLFDHAAFFEDVDGVAVPGCGKAMGYEDDGFVAAEGVYAVLGLCLCLRRRFVERFTALFGVESSSVPVGDFGRQRFASLFDSLLASLQASFFAPALAPLFAPLFYLALKVGFYGSRRYHDSTSEYEVSNQYDDYRVYEYQRHSRRRFRSDRD